jgi:enterobactin synthetase component D
MKIFSIDALQKHTNTSTVYLHHIDSSLKVKHLIIEKRFAENQEIILNYLFKCIPPSIARSVPKRQYEYILGRWGSAILLFDSGCTESESWIDSVDKRPKWPPGYLGSISHSTDAVAISLCKIYSTSLLKGIGIDIENIDNSDDYKDALIMCFHVNEIKLLNESEFGLILGFSVKESLFKCLNPIVKIFFDFLDAEITSISKSSQSVELILKKSLSNVPQGSKFTAYYKIIPFTNQQVWTAIFYSQN